MKMSSTMANINLAAAKATAKHELFSTNQLLASFIRKVFNLNDEGG
jgi:hypothetical protein